MNYTDANKGSSGPPASLYSQQKLLTDAATEKVATLVGEDFDSPDLFCQMDVLRPYLDDVVWKEIGRWVRYEEAVEEGGERWSKPHVASLMMEALLELQNVLATCPVFIDYPAQNITEIVESVVRAWIDDGNFPYMLRDHYKAILLKEHLFQHLSKKEMKKKHASSPNLQKMQNESYINGSYEPTEKYTLTVPTTSSTMPKNMLPKVDPPTPHVHHKTHLNTAFLKKIPPGSEVVNLMVGEIEELDQSISVFIKLKDASNIGDITEVDLPTRFMFIILGPANSLGPSAELCRCLATLFTDEVFRCVAHRARDREDLLAGISEFSQHLTVLPPGTWDPSTRIEPPDEVPSQEHRKGREGTLPKNKSMVSLNSQDNSMEGEENEEESHGDPTLVRSGKLFGGLIADIKRKVPHYLSDFRDALHIQCVASFFFLFLATLTPNVTFGGLLGQATDQYMGTMECILSAAISGIVFALFSGQPLNILGSTGPMLVLENILYQFCKDQEWDFLPFRCWVGFWTCLMILLIVAFDLSALVRYITRFTEESFACLIALIFIYEAFKKTFEINKAAPVHTSPPSIDSPIGCCLMRNVSAAGMYTPTYEPLVNASRQELFQQECEVFNGSFVNQTCPSEVDHYVPDVFLFSIMLFLGTFSLATTLVNFRHSLFFPTFVRQNVSDFAVLISIIIMVILDILVGLPTPKLEVPLEFKPTRPGRPWLINPISDKNPWWLMILSAVPAILATILIFMDQQITAVIVNRGENKLKKGSGYHLDMLVVAVLVVVLALLGLPWYVAATVTALAHVMSLKKVSECTAPGEKPVFLGVREQRVTALLVGIFSGLAVLLTSILNYVPMAVLYGVFLFMGVAPLANMQLIQRILLIFMPTKYQPEYSYIRNVPIRRVHLFTAIQVVNLAVLWVVKSIKSISIAFPLMVLIICFVRKALDKVFTQRELKWLDDLLPSGKEKKEPAVQVQPVFIKVTEFDDAESVATTIGSDRPPTLRKLSVPIYEKEKETDIDREEREKKQQQRQSLTFGLKTEIDQLKGTRPAYLTDRRQSLIMAVERKRSLQTDALTASRRVSAQSSDGTLSGGVSHNTHGGHGHGHSATSHVEEHNRINRILSLPATIEDETETEDKRK